MKNSKDLALNCVLLKLFKTNIKYDTTIVISNHFRRLASSGYLTSHAPGITY